MKNLLKIGALSLALITSVLMLTKTNAQVPGDVSLKIYTGTSECVYGTSLYVGDHIASFDAFTLTGTFNPSTFYCTDYEGLSNWTMTLNATSDLTNQNGQTIPATNVYLKADANQVISGSCTTGTNTTTRTSIWGSPQTILYKSSALGQICTISANNVQLYVYVPANQPVGVYTGTLSLVAPW